MLAQEVEEIQDYNMKADLQMAFMEEASLQHPIILILMEELKLKELLVKEWMVLIQQKIKEALEVVGVDIEVVIINFHN